MPQLHYGGKEYSCDPGESVLSCLRRHKIHLRSSCESGVCQNCLVRVTKGEVPSKSQEGLKETLVAQGCFLACVCVPEDDLHIEHADESVSRIPARIREIAPLNDMVVRVLVEPEEDVDYFAGQFMNVMRPDGLVRSYSLASVPGEDALLEFHVGLIAGGRMSGWFHHEASPGDPVVLIGPQGKCFYVAGKEEQSLLLAGTGTGLAPLYAIARDALRQGHMGPVHLFHGGLDASRLYLVDELRDLETSTPLFHYHPCALRASDESCIPVGSIDDVLLDAFNSLSGWRVYLCGDDALVRILQRKTFLAGASLQEIFADPFVHTPA